MKTKNILFAFDLIVFMILFYDQYLGLNLLLMSLTLVISAIIYNPKIFHKTNILYTFCTLIVNIAAAWFGDNFSIVFAIMLTLGLPLFLFNPYPKLVISWLDLLNNIFSAPFNFMDKFESKKMGGTKNIGLRILTYIILPIFIISIFLLIYTLSNDNFRNLIIDFFSNFNFNFFLVFSLGVFSLILFWFYIPKNKFNDFLNTYIRDKYSSRAVPDKEVEKLNIWKNSATMLFVVLNVVLLVFIISYLSSTYNDEISYFSEIVHEGVGGIIFSVILAILLIFFYFHGKLNFVPHHKILKYSVYSWLILNSILIIITAYRNGVYIQNLGLTFKRLGVFAFLFLCLIGLIFTYLKIYYPKTNYYLIRNMSWTFLIFLSLICPINWSAIITDYNISHADKINLDISYLQNETTYNYYTLVENIENPYLTTRQKNKIKDIIDDKKEQIIWENKTYPTWQEMKIYNELINTNLILE